MSNYVKSTNFTAKDGLPISDPQKVVKGTEIDVEFTAIAGAIATKADLSSPALIGTPTAPTAATGTSTTQLATTAFVQNQISAVFPIGSIILWSGSIVNIPTGWALCNGQNSTPDLRNRFVVGAGDSYAVNATGGSKDAIVVSHTHTATSTVTDPGHNHLIPNTRAGGPNGGSAFIAGATSVPQNVDYTGSNTTGITVGTTVASTGSSGTNANLPPYYALAYIMKIV